MDFPVIIQVQFFIIGILFLLFLFFAGFIIWQRSKKNAREIRRKHIEDNTERWLFDIIHNDNFVDWAEDQKSTIAVKFYFQNHYKTNSDRLLLIDILVHKTYSFSGDIRDRICKVFYMAGLDELVLNQLDNKDWSIKANAMKAAAATKMIETEHKILPYVNSNNPILRQEAQIAYITINPSNLQYLLAHIETFLSDWEIMQIINIISGNKAIYLLYFSPVIDKENPSLSLLSVRIISYFTLTRHAADITVLLDAPDERLVNLTIQALGTLNYSSALPIFKIKYPLLSEKSKTSVLNVFCTLGTLTDADFIIEAIKNESSKSLILLGVKALLSFGLSEIEVIAKLNGIVDLGLLNQMLAHNLDSRIVKHI